jgi:hypothetical protein
MNRLLPALALATAVAAAGCFEFETPEVPDEGRTLNLSFVDLPELGPDYVYEGWLIVDGEPVSTGRFEANPAKQSFDFPLAEENEAGTTFVLTIEPAVGDDPAPSHVHILGGDLADDQADLHIAHGAALGTDLQDASGGYILETPTDDVAENYANGVWFVDSLDLPTLPEGWVYEGWVVVDGEPISTGRFTDPDVADSDGAGPSAGPNAAPPHAGQDFVDPATSLIGGAVVITVEPEPDNSPDPFVFKPLVDEVVEDVGAATLQGMEVHDTSPVGTVTLQ